MTEAFAARERNEPDGAARFAARAESPGAQPSRNVFSVCKARWSTSDSRLII
jgi:amidase